MDFNLNTWIGQVTTGHGAMILGPTLFAAATGSMSWQTAAPFVAAGVIGLLWPENVPAQNAARTVADDVEALIAAYRTGLDHAGTDADAATAPAASSTAPHAISALPALAMMTAAGFALNACANQTSTQVAATQTAVASGLLCLADASGKVVSTATTSDSNALKAINAAIAAGDVLLTDAACQSAFTSGAAALPGAAAPAQQ